jgi:hypothetical protein
MLTETEPNQAAQLCHSSHRSFSGLSARMTTRRQGVIIGQIPDLQSDAGKPTANSPATVD